MLKRFFKDTVMDKKELYEKVFNEALQSKELMLDLLTYLGFTLYKNDGKYIFFKVPYANQKTGSLNVSMDKNTGNWLFYDFLTDWGGNVFTLLNELNLKEGEKINFLLRNYRQHFTLSDNEIDFLLSENTIPKFSLKRIEKISKKISEKRLDYNKLNASQSFLPKILYSNPLFLDMKTAESITKPVQYDNQIKNIKIYSKVTNYLKSERGIDDTKFIFTNLLLKDRRTDEILGFNSAVAVPFGLFNFEKIMSMNEDELKNLLYDYGAELRLTSPVYGVDFERIKNLSFDENLETLLSQINDSLKNKFNDFIKNAKSMNNSEIYKFVSSFLNEIKKMNSKELFKNFSDILTTHNLKSYSKKGFNNPLGKSPTFLYSDSSDKLLIFESIFDYLSVSKYYNPKEYDVIVMNGASMSVKLGELIENNTFYKNYESVTFFLQNDVASINMFNKLINNETFLNHIFFDKLKLFTYFEDESGMDINDLVKNNKIQNGLDLENRIKMTKLINPAPEASFEVSIVKKNKLKN
jgi:predicted DNA-binding antitoxin AbrB/MazE fold protein